jgi:hypothetical protein
MTTTEFAIRAWLAQLSRQTGQLLTWEHRHGVHMLRCGGRPIASLTSMAAVETFLQGYERALVVCVERDIARYSGLEQAA